ncbi:MAG TPA: hypothetical protein VF041_00520 [Gemmatimonadaceae bacterium]
MDLAALEGEQRPRAIGDALHDPPVARDHLEVLAISTRNPMLR